MDSEHEHLENGVASKPAHKKISALCDYAIGPVGVLVVVWSAQALVIWIYTEISSWSDSGLPPPTVWAKTICSPHFLLPVSAVTSILFILYEWFGESERTRAYVRVAFVFAWLLYVLFVTWAFTLPLSRCGLGFSGALYLL